MSNNDTTTAERGIRSAESEAYLPHGPGLRLVTTPGVETGEWREFQVTLAPELSILMRDPKTGESFIPPETGLEIMAQACGMLAAALPGATPGAVGVVGAVRGYEYETRDFRVGEVLQARVKPIMLERELIVCEGELSVVGEERARQRARITVVLQGDIKV